MSGRPWNELDLKPHGTAAAYRRHYRRGEKPCEACRQGESIRMAERYAAARAAGLGPREASRAAHSDGRLERVLAGAPCPG